MDFIFNGARGRTVEFARKIAATSDNLLIVPLDADTLPSDASLRNAQTLSEVLSSATEHTVGRKTVTTVTVNVDSANNRVDVDLEDQVWEAASGSPIGAVVLAYQPSGAPDSQVIPISKHDFAVTPNGTDILLQVAALGFYRAS